MAVTVELPLFLRVGTYREAEVATIEVPIRPTPATDDDGRPGLELRIDFAEFRRGLAGALRAVADELESENSTEAGDEPDAEPAEPA